MTPDFACRIDILKFSPRTIPQQRSYESQGDAVSQVRRLDHKRLGNPATELRGTPRTLAKRLLGTLQINSRSGRFSLAPNSPHQ